MQIPLSLSVYEHAAALIGATPWQASRDADTCYRAHREAYLLYEHFPAVIGIDIYNLEAEAYGCRVREPSGNGIPAIHEPIFASSAAAIAIEPFDPACDGRVPMMIEIARRISDEFPDADIRVPVSGPFSIAQNIIGLNRLMIDVATEPEAVRALLDRLVAGQIVFAAAVIDAGVGVAFFESAAAPPLLSPQAFRRIEAAPLQRAMRRVGEVAGAPAPCIIGGDTAPIVPEMLDTGTDFLICPAETERRPFLEATRGHPEVSVRVNLDPHVYTRGTRRQMKDAVDEVIALSEEYPNVLLGTGAIPYETPPENLLFLKEYAAS